MFKKHIFWVTLLALLGCCVSCGDDQNDLGPLSNVDLQPFEFPQGDDPWDKEIEQIAKDWGMYIIYKNVDSTQLNRQWTTSTDGGRKLYNCETPDGEDIQLYLGIVKEWLLGSMDKTNKDDLKSLPYYLYLVNNYGYKDDENQLVPVMLNKNGFNYWSFSLTTEVLAGEIDKERTHTIACAFSYPALDTRFHSGEYVVSPEFAEISNYENKIGIRYYTFETFKADPANRWMFEGEFQMTEEEILEYYDYFYNSNVMAHEKDPENAYQRRGFAPQVTEDFKLVDYAPTYGAPTWMPWLSPFEGFPDMSWNPAETGGGKLPDVEGRIIEDFLNMIRLAMTFPESTIREMFPMDAADYYEMMGNYMINTKYDVVVKYMKETYRVDLQRYASILDEE